MVFMAFLLSCQYERKSAHEKPEVCLMCLWNRHLAESLTLDGAESW